jgi:phage/plasmid primase-like uncharacterized protein
MVVAAAMASIIVGPIGCRRADQGADSESAKNSSGNPAVTRLGMLCGAATVASVSAATAAMVVRAFLMAQLLSVYRIE